MSSVSTSPQINHHGPVPSTSAYGHEYASQNVQFSESVHRRRGLSFHSEISDLSIDTSTSLNTEYTGPIIPPKCDKSYRQRTLVLCFDGTGDQFDLDNSNVINFFSVLKKGDRKRQLVYYQSGIGTYTIPQVATPIYSKLSKTLDLMFANNLNHHVMSGYKFLMENYKDGDKICIFGFSRGAYVARALAGMVHKVGLLPAGNSQQVPFAYKMFRNDRALGWKQSVAFKRAFSIDVDIAFVGVWDTVASVGLLPATLPFTKSNTAIKVFRHALSLDERRAKFKPSIWERITAEEAKRGDYVPPPRRKQSLVEERGRKQENTREIVEVEEMEEIESVEKVDITERSQSGCDDSEDGNKLETVASKFKNAHGYERRESSSSRSRAIVGTIKRKAQGMVGRVSSDREKSRSRDRAESVSPGTERDQLEQMYLDRSRHTDVLEVWFAGCHCDVGGGSVPNSTQNSLARIPLRWMIRECFLARTGIQFEADSLRELGMDPGSLYPRVLKVLHPEETNKPFASPEQIPVPLPSSNAPMRVNTNPTVESTCHYERVVEKESSRVSTEDSAGNWAEETENAVTVIETENCTSTTSNGEGNTLGLDPGQRRENNISGDGTLVNFERESHEAPPNVNVETASVMDERSSIKSQEQQAVHNFPHLEGVSFPQKHHDTLRIPKTTGAKSSRTRDERLTALEAEQDVFDARSPIYDQLKISKWWWVLEFMAFSERVQQKDGTWKKKWFVNRGHGRKVTQDEPMHVHRSVKMRMESKDLNYTPRVKFEKEPIWVD